MYQQNTNYHSQNVKKINNEQIEQIIKAIIAGKYSWACVLLLRFSGYNPMEYIPYRTYIRLLKNNCLTKQANTQQSDHQEIFHMQSGWMPNKRVMDVERYV
ncbi:MAG TPA: HetP family heterocyst commitment protein [Trichormus sp. M33_DOE_039]|nr:HetP family heterocyst commitment protein [Trichormus sp. M33_DOE_039]